MLRKEPVRPALWALLAATLYVAAMPPWGVWWLAPIAIALLAGSGLRRYSSWALIGSFVSLCAYSWLISVSLWGWLALFAVVGCLWCIPFWLWQRLPNRWGVAAVWVTLEGLRGLLGFGWLPVAVSALGNRVFLSWGTLGGEALLSFIIVFVGLTLAKIFTQGDATQKINQSRNFFILLLILALVGTGLNVTLPKSAARQIRAALVQPNAPMQATTARDYYNDLESLRAYSNALKNDQADLILWPEQATPWPVNDDKKMRAWIEQGASYLQTPIVAGVLWHQQGVYFNAAAVIDPKTGVDPNAYLKRRLVPFGEYIPFAQLGWIRSWTPIAESFGAGDEPIVLRIKTAAGGLKLWPLICYEDTFDNLSWGAAAHADALVVFLNNAWFGYGAADQHAAHSALRAVEQGIPVLRVANNGLSGVIFPNGEAVYLRADGDSQKAQSAVVELPLLRRETLYSHTAPVWRLVFLLSSLAYVILLWRQRPKS